MSVFAVSDRQPICYGGRPKTFFADQRLIGLKIAPEESARPAEVGKSGHSGLNRFLTWDHQDLTATGRWIIQAGNGQVC